MKCLKKFKNHKNEQASVDHKILRNICKKNQIELEMKWIQKIDTAKERI